ncbi:MAG TPA: type II toxin-antitoxin system prevent-host-death family antitoxin [Actinomycetota bacterium]
MDVGVRELKAKLSEYLSRAKAGEVIRVTDRGRPIARLGPLSPHDRIEQGIREGWITPGDGSPPPEVWQGFHSDMTVEELLAEDRGE